MNSRKYGVGFLQGLYHMRENGVLQLTSLKFDGKDQASHKAGDPIFDSSRAIKGTAVHFCHLLLSSPPNPSYHHPG